MKGFNNTALADLLREVGWTPRALATRINQEYGAGTVSGTAPYHWRDKGCVPNPPLPELVANVLSSAVGRVISPGDLWPGRRSETPTVLPADDGAFRDWTRAEAMALVEEWLMTGVLDRRRFLAISGSGLTSIPVGYLVRALKGEQKADDARLPDVPVARQVEATIPMLQQLDDAEGGGSHLRYVGAHFRAVALLLREPGNTSDTEARLLRSLTELGQLAGWMAFDAGAHGLAQRYFFTALLTARECRYDSMAAHVTADLAFQAASRNHATDAVALGETAAAIAEHSSASVRASVVNRQAYAYAVAGRLSDFDRTHGAALDLLVTASGRSEPSWMYYLTPNHLETQAGYALAHAGLLALPGDRSGARRLLRRGQQLLQTGAFDRPLDDKSEQRRAMFEGAWLATACAGNGDFEQACMLGQRAVERAVSVRSARSTDVLARLAARLRRAPGNPYVHDFLPVLDQALSRASSGSHR